MTTGVVALGLTPEAIRRTRNWLVVHGRVPAARIPVVAFELVWRAVIGEWWTD